MLTAFAETFRTLRTNFFQTFLSVLGIVIGVGALVAMLSMIDGLEKYAREQISSSSSLDNITVLSKTRTTLDGISTERERIAVLDEAVLSELLDSLPYPARGVLQYQSTTVGVANDTGRLGLYYTAYSISAPEGVPEEQLLAGLLPEHKERGRKEVTINKRLAARLVGPQDSVSEAVDTRFVLYGDTLTVSGVYDDRQADRMTFCIPLATLRALKESPEVLPIMILTLEDVQDVLDAEEYVGGWMARHFADLPDATESFTQRGRLEQLEQGVNVFRLVMGFIIGVAVVVGGVGVMNVLLMSITERTAEIGVRKAVGASKGSIVRQFLAESVAISTIGSFFGVLLGIGVSLAAAPLLSYTIDGVELEAVFTLNTLLVVAVVALLTGIVFGTYPARKAAGLDPVVAIRR